MATNEQGDLVCVQCGKLLTGRQKLYCSDKCRTAYKRKRTKANTNAVDRPNTKTTGLADLPELESEQKRTRTRSTGRTQTRSDDPSWRDEYHVIKGERDTIKDERDRLLSEVMELRKQTVQLSVERDAALIEKARFEGAYLALSEGKGSIEQVGEAAQSNIVEAKKGKSADTEPIWKRVGRSIKNRF